MASVFLGDHRVSLTEHTMFFTRTFMPEIAAKDIKNFLDGYFSQIVHTELLSFEYGFCDIAPDALAFLIKTLLIEKRDCGILNISVHSTKTEFEFSLSFSNAVDYGEDFLNKLECAADKAGFKLKYCPDTGIITLCAKVYNPPYIPLYSSNSIIISQAFKRIFFL